MDNIRKLFFNVATVPVMMTLFCMSFFILKLVDKMHFSVNVTFLYEHILLGVMLLVVNRLLIQGDIECWQFWQWIAGCYIILFIFPQCLVFLIGPELLHQRFVSSNQFILGLFLPFPLITIWFYIIKYHQRSLPVEIRNVDDEVGYGL